jgi:hypothetical protein
VRRQTRLPGWLRISLEVFQPTAEDTGSCVYLGVFRSSGAGAMATAIETLQGYLKDLNTQIHEACLIRCRDQPIDDARP